MQSLAQKPSPTRQYPSSAFAKPDASTGNDPHAIHNLQRFVGNQAVMRQMQSQAADTSDQPSSPPASAMAAQLCSSTPRLTLQTKLTVNTPGDAYEQEADQIAEQVMRMPEPQVQRTCACGGGCDDCKKKQEPGALQMKSVTGENSAQTEAPPSVHEVLQSPGQPLDSETRAFMEPRFGQDFSRVRVHADSGAGQSAHEVNSRAYTVGQHIVFAPGQFAPDRPAGRSVLAHELTHVVQQRNAGQPYSTVQRLPWGACPEGARVSALGQKFIYEPAELFAITEYKTRAPGNCLLLNQMIAANEWPTCGEFEQPEVEAIQRDFHHGKTVKRRPVQPTKNITKRAETEKIVGALEDASALLQPDIADVTAHEVYDVTTTGQRSEKANKIKSYVRLLTRITGQTWTAGKKLLPFAPLTFPIKPTKLQVCFGPTDFDRWPGVIQYVAIDPGKKGKKDGKEEEEDDENKKKKKGDPTKGGNVGFGIAIMSSGGGKANATIGIAINSHGKSYGTVSAGIVYDSNGTAVGTATAGAGMHMSGTAVGTAAAGAAKDTSGEALATASAGAASNSSGQSAATASAGTSQDSSGVAVATAASGKSKDQSAIVIGKSGKATPDSDASGDGHGTPGGDPQTGGKTGAQPGQPGVQGSGLNIPGVSEADTKKAVAEAANIDALLQKSTPAQKKLMERLAQLSGDRQYAVPSADWVRRVLTITEGLSEDDIAYLETLDWRAGKVAPEEVRKKVQEALKHRSPSPVADSSTGTAAKLDAKVKQSELSANAGSVSSDVDKAEKPEPQDEQIARLFKRAKEHDWKHVNPGGEIVFGKAKIYDQNITVAFYFEEKTARGRLRVTADLSGILRHAGNADTFEVTGAGLLVTTDGRYGSAADMIGLTMPLKK